MSYGFFFGRSAFARRGRLKPDVVGGCGFTPAQAGQPTVVTNLPSTGWWNGDTPDTIADGYEYCLQQDQASFPKVASVFFVAFRHPPKGQGVITRLPATIIITCAPDNRAVPLSINRKREACLDPIHNDHRLETLDVRIFVEETPCELLVIFHVFCCDDEHEVCVASDIKSRHDLSG